MKKRILPLLLSLLLCVSLIPAAGAVSVSDGYTATRIDNVSTYGDHYFHNGLIPVQVPGTSPEGYEINQWTYMNTSGKIVDLVSDKNAFYVFDFSEGLAAFLTFDFKLGYMDTTGKVVIKPQFDCYDSMGTISVGRFINGNALVYNQSIGDWEQIDTKGKKVPLTLDPYGDDYAVISDVAGHPSDVTFETVAIDGEEMELGFTDGAALTFAFQDDYDTPPYLYLIKAAQQAPVTPPVSAPSFTDVKASDWFHDTVTLAAKAGIIAGNADGSFNPNGELTWAQTVTFAVRLVQYSAGEPIYGSADQTGANWYDVYVDYALDAGFLTEVSPTPNAKISRGDAAILFAKVLDAKAPQVNTVPDGFFSDVPAGSSAYDAVYALAEAGVCNGKSAGVFDPDGTFKRSEIATIVARMAGLVEPAVIAQ